MRRAGLSHQLDMIGKRLLIYGRQPGRHPATRVAVGHFHRQQDISNQVHVSFQCPSSFAGISFKYPFAVSHSRTIIVSASLRLSGASHDAAKMSVASMQLANDLRLDTIRLHSSWPKDIADAKAYYLFCRSTVCFRPRLRQQSSGLLLRASLR